MKILKIKSLNINSLKGEFEIDFEKFLKDESLFAITGPTGAGKSTILDIITCAMYARTARLSNPNELMSRHTAECLCEVEFDRFIQSMMLAQGSFDAFLKARENERSTLLEKITGTQIYKQISCEIYETYNSKKKDIELDENSLGSIELLANEIVVEKTLILNNSKAQKLELDAIEVKLKNVAIWLENLQKLEVDNAKYIQEFEQISFEKESKKEDFIKLEFANKALNIQPIYQEKNSLLQIINQDKKNLRYFKKSWKI